LAAVVVNPQLQIVENPALNHRTIRSQLVVNWGSNPIFDAVAGVTENVTET
jgi:hypothetical protein